MVDEVLHSFEIGTREVRFQLHEWRGKIVADVRTYVFDREGNAVPTQRGIQFDVELLWEFSRGVTMLKAEAAGMELIPPVAPEPLRAVGER